MDDGQSADRTNFAPRYHAANVCDFDGSRLELVDKSGTSSASCPVAPPGLSRQGLLYGS